jgi:hypothetical protein
MRGCIARGGGCGWPSPGVFFISVFNRTRIFVKTRYDIVEYENTKTICRNTVIMADYGSMQEELMKCREEMNEVMESLSLSLTIGLHFR